MSITPTPAPPYYAVVFTSKRTQIEENYAETNSHLEQLVKDIEIFSA